MAKTEPVTLEFAESAPYQVNCTVEVATSAANVFDVLKDNRGGEKWLGWIVTKVVPTSDPEHGVGATRKVVWLYGLGGLTETFIGWEEPTLWSFTANTVRPGVFSRFMERVTVEPVSATSCRVHYRAGIDFSWWARPFSGFVTGYLGKAIRPALEDMGAIAVANAEAAGRITS
ncbi:hypothetical protein GCM10027167_90310 [Nocardia heshunensis]